MKDKKAIIRTIVIIAIIAVGIIWVCSHFFHLGNVEWTDNAQVRRNIVPINSRVQGYIERICFNDFEEVHKGDTLVVIENSEHLLRVAQANAAYQRSLVENTAMGTTISTTENNLSVNDAAIDELKVRLAQFSEVLSRLKARDGVISILGNHDYCIYHRYKGDDTPERALARVVKSEELMGWNLLRNQSVQIRRGNDSIAIVGVENAGIGHFPDKSDLRKALTGLPGNECKILLSHDPSHWRREVLPTTDIPLMLAGHTHAMQFKLGNFSPSKWTYPEWGGLYREGNQQLYVSTGVGGNIAFRFGVYPTIDILTLHCDKAFSSGILYHR